MRRSHVLAGLALLWAASAIEVRAHGFLIPAPPAQGTPAGGVPGTPGTSVPPAGGGVIPVPGTGTTTPGGGPAGGTFSGPAGGGTPGQAGAGGGDPGQAGAGGGEPPRPGGPVLPPVRVPTGARPDGGVGGGPRGVGAKVAARRPRASDPWLKEIGVPWRPELLPAFAKEGYASAPGTLTDALKRPVSEGGFLRDGRPVFVAVYDAKNAEHVKALDALDADARVRTAAHFFECIRVDAAPTDAGAEGLRFFVFDASGDVRGESKGVAARPSRIYDLLAATYGAKGGDLGAACDTLDPLLKARARVRHDLKHYSSAVVCPDCGERRTDAEAHVADLRLRLSDAEQRIGAAVARR